MQHYDLTIHVDEDGDAILEGTSPAGQIYTDALRGDIVGDLAIACTAEEFMQTVPKNLVVGLYHPCTDSVQKLCPPLLH